MHGFDPRCPHHLPDNAELNLCLNGKGSVWIAAREAFEAGALVAKPAPGPFSRSLKAETKKKLDCFLKYIHVVITWFYLSSFSR